MKSNPLSDLSALLGLTEVQIVFSIGIILICQFVLMNHLLRKDRAKYKSETDAALRYTAKPADKPGAAWLSASILLLLAGPVSTPFFNVISGVLNIQNSTVITAAITLNAIGLVSLILLLRKFSLFNSKLVSQ